MAIVRLGSGGLLGAPGRPQVVIMVGRLYWAGAGCGGPALVGCRPLIISVPQAGDAVT